MFYVILFSPARVLSHVSLFINVVEIVVVTALLLILLSVNRVQVCNRIKSCFIDDGLEAIISSVNQLALLSAPFC